MKSLIQQVLGADWDALPPALQAHYHFGTTSDTGRMDIEYPPVHAAVPASARPVRCTG